MDTIKGPANKSLFHLEFLPPNLSGDILLIRESTLFHTLTVLNKLLIHKTDNGNIDVLSKSEKLSDWADTGAIRKEYLHFSDCIDADILKKIFGKIEKKYNTIICCTLEDPSINTFNFMEFFGLWKLFFHAPNKTFFINKHFWVYSFFEFLRIQKPVYIGDKKYYYNAMLTADSKQKLVDLALNASPHGEIVEIGRGYGGSAVGFAICLKRFGKKLFSVDTGNHPMQDEFLSLYGVKDNIHIFNGGSVEAYQYWRKKYGPNISMVFIDGDHNEESVALDIKLWSELLIPNGIICLHEYGYNDDFQSTKIIYQEIISKFHYFKDFECKSDLFIARKK